MVANLAEIIDAKERLASPLKNRLHVARFEEHLIRVPLRWRELAKEHLLTFLGKIGRHINLQTLEQVRANCLLQRLGAFLRRHDLEICCISIPSDLDRDLKLGSEV